MSMLSVDVKPIDVDPIIGYGVEVNELLDGFKNSNKKIFRDFYQGFLDYKDHLQNTVDDQDFDNLESDRINGLFELDLLSDVVVTRPWKAKYYVLIPEISPIINDDTLAHNGAYNEFHLYTRDQANEVIFQAFSKVWLDGYPFKSEDEQSAITDELKKRINKLAKYVVDVDYHC